MANTFREVYKKTGDSSYQLVGNVGVNGIKLDIMKGASSSSAGEIGLVPKPNIGQQDYLLTGDGSWQNISKYLGTASISDISDGTVKGAIKTINENIFNVDHLNASCKPYAHLSSDNVLNIGMFKLLNIVTIEIVWKGSVGEKYSTLTDYTIPSRFRPKTMKFFSLFNNSNGILEYGGTRIQINTNGSIGFSTNHLDSVERYGSITYMIE